MQSRGFTLVEMLVVMTIGAILIAAAVPAFQWTISRNRVSDASNLILSSLEYARMEASRRGNTVAMCRSLDIITPACSSAATATADGNDWAVGWLVFEKAPGNVDEANVEVGDQVIFRQQGDGTGRSRVMIHSSIGGSERYAYLPRGTGGVVGGAATFAIDYGPVLTPISAARDPATITLTNAARCLVLNIIGSARPVRAVGGVCP
jgi:type IV fimbrial biogenesis protein FimT